MLFCDARSKQYYIQVSYDYRVEAFPGRGLPSGPQVGWIAQDVQQAIPELVISDADGFLYVSYAHATPLVAEAVVELSSELDELRKQMQEDMPVRDCAAAVQRVVSAEQELAAVKRELVEVRDRMERLGQALSKLLRDE